MGHIFISYSRKDTAFVRRLHDAFARDGRETWVDWEGIPPSDKWMAKIHAAIDEAEAFVLVISPDSIASAVCCQELDYAVDQHKRLIPILHREPEDAVPAALAEINYVLARDGDPFDSAVATLKEAIDTDLDWVRQHTRLLVRAVEWDRLGRETSYTLRGSDLRAFEEWATQAPDKSPKPTVLQSEYLLASRRAVTRRQQLTWASLAAGLVIVAVVGTVAWFQKEERDRQAEIATARQQLSQAEGLRDVGGPDRNGAFSYRRSLREAAAALATLDRLGESTFDADRALRKTYAVLPKWDAIPLGSHSVEASAFDTTGRFAAVAVDSSEVQAWDIAARRRVASCEIAAIDPAHAAGRQVEALSISSDGRRMAIYVYSANTSDRVNPVIVVSLEDCDPLLRVEIERKKRDSVRQFALTPDGTQLVVIDQAYQLAIWDIDAGTRLTPAVEPDTRTRSFAISTDGHLMASYEGRKTGGGTQLWLRIRALSDGTMLKTLTASRAEPLSWKGGTLHADDAPVWSLPDPEALDGRNGHERSRQAVTDPDERLSVRRISDRDLEVHGATDEVIARLEQGSRFVAPLLRQDGRAVLVADHWADEIGIWYFRDAGAYARVGIGERFLGIAFDASGEHLVATHDGGPRQWQMPARGRYAAPVEVAANGAVAPDALWVRRQLPPGDEGEGEVLGQAEFGPGLRAAVVAGEWRRAGVERKLEVWSDGEKRSLELPPMLDFDMESFVQFAGGGRYVLVGVPDGLEVLETATLASVTTLRHQAVTVAAMQSDGGRAVTVGADGQARIWDIAGGFEVAQFEIEPAPRAAALSADRRWLATLDASGIGLWAIAPGDLVVQACRWLKRPCP